MTGRPRLIGCDWGTTSLRAYLLGDDGVILDRRAEALGVMAVAAGGFAAILASVVAGWTAGSPHLPVLACGMIGSTEGWVHAPYRNCPADTADLASALVRAPAARDGGMFVVPGVRSGGLQPSLMRGEETQIAGALRLAPQLGANSLLVLPGTHAKWARIEAQRITRFATYMTGEIFAVLSEHSILGRLARASGDAAVDPAAADAAFDRGVALARDNGARGVAPLLFLARALVLDGALEPGVSRDFLSGLLIGEEVRSASVDGAPAALVGEPALCARYGRALRAFACGDPLVIGDSAPAGLWEIATRAGLAGDAAPISRDAAR